MGKPQSFSYNLLKGDPLVVGTYTKTLQCAYLVQGTPEKLTLPFLQEWFMQSIEPLVGSDAAAILKKFMVDNPTLAKEFLSSVLRFRRSLK